VQKCSVLARKTHSDESLQMSGVVEIRYRKVKSIARSGCVATDCFIGDVNIRCKRL